MANGSTLLTDVTLKRWGEHFNSVLNRPSATNDNAITRLPQIECNVLFDEFPNVNEIMKAIQHLAKFQVQVPFLQRSTKSCFTACGGRTLSHNYLRMQP